jgi:hypothetical protein
MCRKNPLERLVEAASCWLFDDEAVFGEAFVGRSAFSSSA